MSNAQIRAERKRYFDEAKRMAAALKDKWQHQPPRWSPPTGRPDIDQLVWFDYVHTDAPWERLPALPPRPPPSRCSVFTEASPPAN